MTETSYIYYTDNGPGPTMMLTHTQLLAWHNHNDQDRVAKHNHTLQNFFIFTTTVRSSRSFPADGVNVSSN